MNPVIARVVEVEDEYLACVRRWLNQQGIKYEVKSVAKDKSLIMFEGTQRDVEMVEELGTSIDLS